MTQEQAPAGSEGKRTEPPLQSITFKHVARGPTIRAAGDPVEELLATHRKQSQAQPQPSIHSSRPGILMHPIKSDLPSTSSTAGTSYNRPSTPNHSRATSTPVIPSPVLSPGAPFIQRRKRFNYTMEHERYLAQLFSESNAWEILSGSASQNPLYSGRTAVYGIIAKRFSDKFSTKEEPVLVNQDQIKRKLRTMHAAWEQGVAVLKRFEIGDLPSGETEEDMIGRVNEVCHFFFTVHDQWSTASFLDPSKPAQRLDSIIPSPTGLMIESEDEGEDEEEEKQDEGEKVTDKGKGKEKEKDEEQKDEEEKGEEKQEGTKEGHTTDDNSAGGSNSRQETSAVDSPSKMNGIIENLGVSGDRMEVSASSDSSAMYEQIEEEDISDSWQDPTTWDNPGDMSASTNQKKRAEIPGVGSAMPPNFGDPTREGLYLKRRKLIMEETIQADQRGLVRMQKELLHLQIVKLEREMADDEKRRKFDLEHEIYRRETEKMKLEVERKKVLVEQLQLDKILAQGQGGKDGGDVQATINVEATLHINPPISMHNLHGPPKAIL
ncbi:hypothetical protein EMPS_10067 [Entomortierella parvispora]|uniref:Uncharacterized protein n=1 Tax=Entomortierella parvispora TaxID=205924 RepID=A0A9P3M0W8_9FUNG|nr:hypothetical protein EMPS_10067 [Entomortierella parvispora]